MIEDLPIAAYCSPHDNDGVMVAMVGMCEIIGWGRGMIYRHEEEPNTNKLWLRRSIMLRYAPSYPTLMAES